MNGGKPRRGKKNGFELVRGKLGSVWEKNFAFVPFPFSSDGPTTESIGEYICMQFSSFLHF